MTLQDPRRQRELTQLLRTLSVPHLARVNWTFLDQALTHATYADLNYEELEFVGDAVIRLAAAEFLLETYPQLKVGEMTAIRSVLVSDRCLAKLADHYNIQRYLLTSSSGGDRQGQETRLAAAFEAVLAALYLSTHDLSLIRPWLDEPLRRLAEEVRQDPAKQNYKGALQELTNATYKLLPTYQVQELSQIDGDEERFEASVWLQEQCLAVGRGASKKLAEQSAARLAFDALRRSLDQENRE